MANSDDKQRLKHTSENKQGYEYANLSELETPEKILHQAKLDKIKKERENREEPKRQESRSNENLEPADPFRKDYTPEDAKSAKDKPGDRHDQAVDKSDSARESNLTAPAIVTHDPRTILASVYEDRELSSIVRQYIEISPWEAFKDLSVQIHRDDNKIVNRTTIEKYEHATNFDSEENKKSDSADKEKGKAQARSAVVNGRDVGPEALCDKEDFACIVPVVVANKLAGFRTIEPETMVYLSEKYAYLEKYISRENENRHEKTTPLKGVNEAAEHARTQMKPFRDRRNPERQERARVQIEILQEASERSYYFPRIHHYAIAVSRCDCRDGYFIHWASEVVGWDKFISYLPRVERKIHEPIKEHQLPDREYGHDDDFER